HQSPQSLLAALHKPYLIELLWQALHLVCGESVYDVDNQVWPDDRIIHGPGVTYLGDSLLRTDDLELLLIGEHEGLGLTETHPPHDLVYVLISPDCLAGVEEIWDCGHEIVVPVGYRDVLHDVHVAKHVRPVRRDDDMPLAVFITHHGKQFGHPLLAEFQA